MSFLNFGKKKKNDSDSDSNLSTPEKSSPTSKKGSIIINHKRSNSNTSSLIEVLSPEVPKNIELMDPKFKKRKIFGGSLNDSDEAIPPIIEKLMLYIELKCFYFFNSKISTRFR
jgi:hypothetical protein